MKTATIDSSPIGDLTPIERDGRITFEARDSRPGKDGLPMVRIERVNSKANDGWGLIPSIASVSTGQLAVLDDYVPGDFEPVEVPGASEAKLRTVDQTEGANDIRVVEIFADDGAGNVWYVRCADLADRFDEDAHRAVARSLILTEADQPDN